MIERIKILAKKLPQEKHLQGSNAGLWLDKFLIDQSRENKESRRDLVNQVASIPEPADYKSLYDRWEKGLKDYGAVTHKANVNGRMVLGTGNESLIETAVTLHRTYGVPYIPGSALKGLAASFAHQHFGEQWQSSSEAHRILFGTTELEGYVTFYDALHIPGTGAQSIHGKRPLHADVLTVHHRGYYQEKNPQAPTDWDDPNPVSFLSATGEYLIALAAPKDCEAWCNTALKILASALKYEGIGAKTSSGYGRMTISGVELPKTDI